MTNWGEAKGTSAPLVETAVVYVSSAAVGSPLQSRAARCRPPTRI